MVAVVAGAIVELGGGAAAPGDPPPAGSSPSTSTRARMHALIAASSFRDIGDAPPSFPGKRPFKLALDGDTRCTGTSCTRSSGCWSPGVSSRRPRWSPAAARRARAGPCFHMLRTPPRSPTSFLLRAPAPFRDYLRSVRPSSSTCSATACTPSTSSACLPTAVIRRVRSSRGGRGRELGLLRSGQYVAATALSCPRGACCNAHERKRMRRRKKQSKLPRCCVPPQKCHGFVEMETMQEEFSEHDELIHQMADILYTENMSR